MLTIEPTGSGELPLKPGEQLRGVVRDDNIVDVNANDHGMLIIVKREQARIVIESLKSHLN